MKSEFYTTYSVYSRKHITTYYTEIKNVFILLYTEVYNCVKECISCKVLELLENIK